MQQGDKLPVTVYKHCESCATDGQTLYAHCMGCYMFEFCGHTRCEVLQQDTCRQPRSLAACKYDSGACERTGRVQPDKNSEMSQSSRALRTQLAITLHTKSHRAPMVGEPAELHLCVYLKMRVLHHSLIPRALQAAAL